LKNVVGLFTGVIEAQEQRIQKLKRKNKERPKSPAKKRAKISYEEEEKKEVHSTRREEKNEWGQPDENE